MVLSLWLCLSVALRIVCRRHLLILLSRFLCVLVFYCFICIFVLFCGLSSNDYIIIDLLPVVW